MITTGSKWYFGFGFLALVFAAAYGWTTGGNGLGPVSLGYKGGVGDHFGYGLLLAASAISFFLGVVVTATRDADAEAVAQVAGTETVPAVIPAGTSYWPPIAAFGVVLLVIGLVSEAVLVVFGLILMGIALVEWTVQAWADRATGDPETNRRIRNKLMNPIEFPLAGALALGVIAISLSRVFLHFTSDQTVLAGVVVTALIVIGAFWVASRPNISSNVVVGLVVAGAVAIIAIGVAGAVSGPREVHEEEGGLRPPAPIAEVVR